MTAPVASESAPSDLWNDFNLAERNPDPGGGILYALRYDRGHLEAHRDLVVGALEGLGAAIEAEDFGFGVSAASTDEAGHARILHLLEELSVINEALEYAGLGFDQASSISGLANLLIADFVMNVSNQTKVSFLNQMDIGIPSMIRDIETADAQNKVLSPRDRQALRDLGHFAARQAHNLSNRRVIIVGTS